MAVDSNRIFPISLFAKCDQTNAMVHIFRIGGKRGQRTRKDTTCVHLVSGAPNLTAGYGTRQSKW